MAPRAAAKLRDAGRRRLPGTLTIPATDGLVMAANSANKMAAASQPLQVHDGGDEVGLDAHVGEAAPDGARQSVPCLGLAVDAFDAHAVAAVEPTLALTPAGVPPPRPQLCR